jgi:Arc-like DNA binding domain
MFKKLLVRLPIDVKSWLEAQAELNASSHNSEIIRCCRERMERVPREVGNTPKA